MKFNLSKFEKLLSKIIKDEKLKYTFLSVFLVLVLWWSISVEMGLIGLLSLLAYWFIIGVWLADIFRRIVKFNDFFSLIFGIFLAIYLSGFGMAFWIVIYKINVGLMMITLMALVIIIFTLKKLEVKKGERRKEKKEIKDDDMTNWNLTFRNDELEPKERVKNSLMRVKRKWWIVVGFLVFIAINILFYARTGDYILSPWDKINPAYTYLYIVITFFVLLVIFSKCKVRTILLVIILHSFLLHSYLPIVYKTGFGGDKWRHVAAEKWLDDGNIFSPSLFGEEEISYKKIGPLKVPEVFIVGNKTSYANQWGLTMLLGKAMHLDFFKVDLFLGFFLWSIFIPLFLFKLGKFFIRDRLFLGLLAFSPSLFYPFQVYGSITLPVAFGFLYFIFALILWLTYLEQENKKTSPAVCVVSASPRKTRNPEGSPNGIPLGPLGQENKSFLPILLILTALMYFSYLIYFILILMVGLLIVYFKKFILPHLFNGVEPTKKILKWFFISVAIFFLIIPALDGITGFSSFKFLDIFKIWMLPVNILEFILGKLLALGIFIPRPTFISQGNFIFMQIWESMSRATLFRFVNWPAIVSIFVWLMVLLGIFRIGKARSFRTVFLWILVLVILVFDHFVSMYYMDGVRLLIKRFDLAIAFFIAPLFSWGIYWLIVRDSRIFSLRARILVISMILAVFSGVVYASGPKLEVVTEDEWVAAIYVTQEIKSRYTAGSPLRSENKEIKKLRDRGDLINNVNDFVLPKTNYCVLANTWPLLAVEMVSGSRIAGGGFPLYTDYAQPERVQVWKKMTRIPSLRYLEKAREMTGADFCYFMIEKRWLGITDDEKKERFDRLKEMFDDYYKIGDVYIFYYGPSDIKY